MNDKRDVTFIISHSKLCRCDDGFNSVAVEGINGFVIRFICCAGVIGTAVNSVLIQKFGQMITVLFGNAVDDPGSRKLRQVLKQPGISLFPPS